MLLHPGETREGHLFNGASRRAHAGVIVRVPRVIYTALGIVLAAVYRPTLPCPESGANVRDRVTIHDDDFNLRSGGTGSPWEKPAAQRVRPSRQKILRRSLVFASPRPGKRAQGGRAGWLLAGFITPVCGWPTSRKGRVALIGLQRALL